MRNETTIEMKTTPLLCREYVAREVAQGWRVVSIGEGRITWQRAIVVNGTYNRTDNLG
jgi:hypothetical protein